MYTSDESSTGIIIETNWLTSLGGEIINEPRAHKNRKRESTLSKKPGKMWNANVIIISVHESSSRLADSASDG